MNSPESGFNSERDIPKLFVNAVGALAVRQEAHDYLKNAETSSYSRRIDIGISQVAKGDQIELALHGRVSGAKGYHEDSKYFGSRWRTEVHQQVVTGIVNTGGSDVRLEDPGSDYQRSQGAERFNLKGIIRELLSIDDAYQPDGLMKAAIMHDIAEMPNVSKPMYYRQIIEAFTESDNIDRFLGHLSAQPESLNYDSFVSSLNMRVSLLYNQAERSVLHSDFIKYESASIELVRALEKYNLLRPDVLWSIPLLSNPYVASVIASTEKLGEMFDGFSSHARRHMGITLIEKLLDDYAQPESNRNHHNAALVKKVLVNDKSYKRDLPLLEFIKLANQFTDRINQSKPESERQVALPIDVIGTSMLVNSGEALFRIFAMTSTRPEHTEQNRDIATIFDALLEADYRKYIKSRPVTVADVCVRYPDAIGDLVFDLQESARANGYSAASKLYKETLRQQGKRVFFDKRKAGKGIIS